MTIAIHDVQHAVEFTIGDVAYCRLPFSAPFHKLMEAAKYRYSAHSDEFVHRMTGSKVLAIDAMRTVATAFWQDATTWCWRKAIKAKKGRRKP